MNKVLEYFKGDELAASTWQNKYAAKGEVTPDDTHKRLAKEFARIEEYYNSNLNSENKLKLSEYGCSRSPLTEDAIFELFKDFKYVIPGGSVMAGCGTKELVSLSNCFVIGSPKDSYAEIMKTRNQQVQLMKRRGGVGYDLSNLRPRGASVNNAAKSSTGAASFMDVCSDLDFLRVIYFVKGSLIIVRALVPIILIIMATIDIYKVVIKTNEKPTKTILNRFIAAFFVFFVPTFLNVVLNSLGQSNIGESVCWINANESNIKLLKKYMNTLTKREKEILIKRYGLDGNEEITQKEIAEYLGISRSYVSRIEKRATTKILREFIKNKKFTN